MRRPAAGPGAATSLLAAALLSSGCPGEAPPGPEAEVAAVAEVGEDEEGVPVRLYFPGRGGKLFPEERRLPPLEDPEQMVRAVASEVLKGPQGEGLHAPLAGEVEVVSVYLSEERVAYIDLGSADPDPPASGSLREMLAVYSLVNSVLANVPEVRAVALLWNGRQRATFAGHLDTGRPLVADNELVGSVP